MRVEARAALPRRPVPARVASRSSAVRQTERVDQMHGVRYATSRPYLVRASLDELAGPTGGLVEMPSSLAWSGRRRYDLDIATDRLWLYKRVLEEAQTAEDLRRLINPSLLRGMWVSLPLSRRVRPLWEDRFPELAIRLTQAKEDT